MKTIRYDSSRNFLAFVTVFILYLAFSTGTSQAQWTKVALNDTTDFSQIIFVDSLHGYIAAKSASYPYAGVVYVTSDGGKTWNGNKINGSYWLSGVSAIGDSLVWVSSGGTVYYSHDGGRSWQTDTITINGAPVAVITIQFVDSLNGWITGNYGYASAGIFHSTDAGATWKPQFTYSSDNFTHMGKGFFTDKLHGWVAYYYYVSRTTNGGVTWTPEFADDYMWSVFFLDTLKGWAIGSIHSFRTTDGGQNWVELPSDTASYNFGISSSVFFADTSNGWIGAGKIYHTTDGGLSWIVQRSAPSAIYNSIYFLSKNNGWAVGNGIVLHTTNGGVTAIDEPSPSPTAFRLFQNYPNPFNPSTTITYALPENGMVTIKVYDILGREIAVLTDGFNTAGSHSVVWSGKDSKGRDVSSGVYFYNIKFKDQIVVKKMLMLK